jgi:hypothetical protein
LRENLTWFVQGDYLRDSLKNWGGFGSPVDFKATAWSFYTGLQYSLPYGVSFELGWKHEWLRWTNDDAKFKGRADSIYGLVGFEF